ncbi:MAG: hypothetical protein AB8H12_16080 [Lewinella sp.]
MQRSPFHRGLVMLAGLLLCLHTAIPHVHGVVHSNEQPIEISGNSSCVDAGLLHLIKDLLSSDLGEDHLENFTPDFTKDHSILALLAPTTITAFFPNHYLVLPSVTSAQQVASYLADLPPDDPIVGLEPSRGPPEFA